MNSEEAREREERALEALIVSQLSSHCEGEDIDPDDLPELNEEELAAMNGLGGDFVTRLIALYDSRAGDARPEPTPRRKRQVRPRGLVHGLNRASEIGDEAAKELERKREEALRELEERSGGDKDGKD